MHFEAGQSGLFKLSPNKLDKQQGALYNTLKPIYEAGHKFKDTWDGFVTMMKDQQQGVVRAKRACQRDTCL